MHTNEKRCDLFYVNLICCSPQYMDKYAPLGFKSYLWKQHNVCYN